MSIDKSKNDLVQKATAISNQKVYDMEALVKDVKLDKSESGRLGLCLCKTCFYDPNGAYEVDYSSAMVTKHKCLQCTKIVSYGSLLCKNCATKEHMCSNCLSDLFGEPNRKTHFKIVEEAEKLIKDALKVTNPPSIFQPTIKERVDIDFDGW